MKVQLPAIFIRPVFKMDRSVKLEFETRELSGTELAILSDMRSSEGWLLFSPNELKETDVPDEKADSMTGQRTQAQRIRGVLFKLYEQGGSKGDFENYYKTMTERIIEQLKEKIE